MDRPLLNYSCYLSELSKENKNDWHKKSKSFVIKMVMNLTIHFN